jgi:betaine lipid synthase
VLSCLVVLTFCLQIGGGTGWNIEAMSAFVSVPDFFSSIYLVDFSPSLCEVARKRFTRLGWKNVTVVCQDARTFRLEDYEKQVAGLGDQIGAPVSYFGVDTTVGGVGGAELVTLSYSLSMIVSFFPLSKIFWAVNLNAA